jgi:predicted peptidase
MTNGRYKMSNSYISVEGSGFINLNYNYRASLRLPIPNNQRSNKRYPLIVYLHQAGFFNTLQPSHLSDETTKIILKHDFALLQPTNIKDDIWNPDDIYALISNMQEKYTMIDFDKICICGFSAGARGTWDTLCKFPYMFKCAIVASGFCCYLRASQVKIPVLAFHAKDDKTVPIDEVEKMARASPNVNLIKTNLGGHCAYSDILSMDNVLSWIKYAIK